MIHLRWRRYARPTPHTLLAALMEKFGELEESTSWAGRAIDPTMKMKHDLGRTTSRVLEDVEKIDRRAHV